MTFYCSSSFRPLLGVLLGLTIGVLGSLLLLDRDLAIGGLKPGVSAAKRTEQWFPNTSSPSSCTTFHAYPEPDHGQGLPYLADVFATRDAEWIVFIGINRGVCEPAEWKESDNFMDHESRFICTFPGQVHVISEPVAPTGYEGKCNFIFRCKLPAQFQQLVEPGQTTTRLHVDLHAISNPQAPKVGMTHLEKFPSQPIDETPHIANIPICHAGHANLTKPYNLVAYTRVLGRPKKGVSQPNDSNWQTTLHRLTEWMDYHLSQGFDHFILYDHDDQPHGPIERITQPYVDAGLVTYRWWPLSDCVLNQPDNPQQHGHIIRTGQSAGGLAALHRLGQQGAKFLAHMDVDEAFVVYDNSSTVLDLVQSKLGDDDKYDVMKFKPTILEHCNGTMVQSVEDSYLAKRQCLTSSHYFDVKLILRTDRMLHFQVHYALATWDWTLPKAYTVRDTTEGFLAHLRGDMVPGTKRTDYTERIPYFDAFLQARQQAEASGVPYYLQFVDRT